MALRVLIYAGLLWQHLVTEKRLPPDGRLPPILPVVLYNGDRRWAAPLALLFRLESSPDPAQVVILTDALLAWFRRHPGFEWLQSVFVDMLGAILAPLAPGVRVPDELLEMRNMLATRWEVWEQQRQEGEQKAEQKGRQEGRQEGEQKGRQEGEAALLRRLLERRFGVLPDWARDRIAAADSAALEEWGLRVLDAGSLDDVLA
jgi:hypothetical protein